MPRDKASQFVRPLEFADTPSAHAGLDSATQIARHPTSRFLLQVYSITALWIVLSIASAAAVGQMSALQNWLWSNPLRVVGLLFAVSLTAMHALPHLSRLPTVVVLLVSTAEAAGLGAGAEAVMSRYLRTPAAPVFLVAATQFALLAVAAASVPHVLGPSRARTLLAAIVAGALSAITVYAPSRGYPMYTAALPVVALIVSIVVTIDQARGWSLALVAGDQSQRIAAMRVAALILCDLVYFPVLLTGLGGRRASSSR